MIALFQNGKRLRAAQEEIALLKEQLAALSAQVGGFATPEESEVQKRRFAALEAQVAALATPEETTLLKQQLAALTAQVPALAAQLAAGAERAALADGQALLMRERLDALEAAAARHASTMDAQADRIEALRALFDGNEEAVKQGRGALARVEKQFAADLAELRRFDAAMATTMLRTREQNPPGIESRQAALRD